MLEKLIDQKINPLIQIQNLNILQNDISLFNNFNFEIYQNQIIGIFAPTGTGKTTLLNLIADIELSKDFQISGKIIRKSNFLISYVFQEPRLLESISVLKNVMLPLKNKIEIDKAQSKVHEILKELDLIDKINTECSKLSGGEKQRVSLARALIYPCDILLMDEPFTSQDKEKKEKLITKIKEILTDSKKTCVIVSHNEDELKKMNSKIIDYSNFK